MAFLSGPRQVGKSTVAHSVIAQSQRSQHLNWDNVEDRLNALQNPSAFRDVLLLDDAQAMTTVCAIDELHKQFTWRDCLKSIYDTYPELRLLITGSGMLTHFSHGGDSLRGRYFPFTLHPISVAELVRRQTETTKLIHEGPREIPEDQWDALRRFGGFPEPFLKAEATFHNQWSATRHDQLLREEIRDLTRVHELSQVEALALLLERQVGSLTNYSNLSRRIRCSVDSIRRWIDILKSLFYCFAVTPWFKNLNRALRKEPKFYLWDWSQVNDIGARNENLVACALLKATQFWTEIGRGSFVLHFLRDKEKREVDFLVVRDGNPWILVEVKSSTLSSLSPHLVYYKEKLAVPHAVQVAFDGDFLDADCVFIDRPMIVPARSFLSQLV